MAGQALATDFGEPRMAAYLQKHIFDTAGPLVEAPWCSGLGAVPEGYSCYAANTIESGHKSLRQLLSGAPRRRNVGQLLLQVSEAGEVWLSLPVLTTRKRGQRIQAEDVEDDTGKTASSLGLISCFFEDKVSSRKVSSAASHVSHQGKTLGQDDYLWSL